MTLDKKINYNQVDTNIEKWLPPVSRRYNSFDTANRTMLRMFFEELRNVNNMQEALRNTAKRLAPFGINPARLMTVTSKWREAHGFKQTPVFTTRTSKNAKLFDAASSYFNKPLNSIDEIINELEHSGNVAR